MPKPETVDPWFSTPAKKRKRPPQLLTLADEDREQLEELSREHRAPKSRIATAAIRAFAAMPEERRQKLVDGARAFSMRHEILRFLAEQGPSTRDAIVEAIARLGPKPTAEAVRQAIADMISDRAKYVRHAAGEKVTISAAGRSFLAKTR